MHRPASAACVPSPSAAKNTSWKPSPAGKAMASQPMSACAAQPVLRQAATRLRPCRHPRRAPISFVYTRTTSGSDPVFMVDASHAFCFPGSLQRPYQAAGLSLRQGWAPTVGECRHANGRMWSPNILITSPAARVTASRRSRCHCAPYRPALSPMRRAIRQRRPVVAAALRLSRDYYRIPGIYLPERRYFFTVRSEIVFALPTLGYSSVGGVAKRLRPPP